MEAKELEVWMYYYYSGFQMEYMWYYLYNYLFKIKLINDYIIQEIGSLDRVYKNQKEMMIAMYGHTIESEIKKLEDLKKDRKEYKNEIIEQLKKISKDLWDNAIINAVISWENVQVAWLIAQKVKSCVDAYIEKYIKLP